MQKENNIKTNQDQMSGTRQIWYWHKKGRHRFFAKFNHHKQMQVAVCIFFSKCIFIRFAKPSKNNVEQWIQICCALKAGRLSADEREQKCWHEFRRNAVMLSTFC